MTEPPRLPWTEEHRLLAAVDTATRYYRDNLLAADGAGPRAYLADRGVEHVLDSDSILQVGYAPAGWNNLACHLRAAGFADKESIAAGLVIRCRRGTLIDRFRDRLVVPIRDHIDGNVIAFTARAAPGAPPVVPKYLNTATTALYRKSDELLGLHEQRQALLAGVSPVLVEGAFDVLAMASPAAGDRLAPVSPCGTRVSPYQLAELLVVATSRRLVIAFDNDAAGRAASEWTLGLASAAAPASVCQRYCWPRDSIQRWLLPCARADSSHAAPVGHQDAQRTGLPRRLCRRRCLELRRSCTAFLTEARLW